MTPPLSQPPDWWQDYQNGDFSAFARLVEEHRDLVLGVALSAVRDTAMSEDVAQETFLAAYLQREQVRDPSRIGAWLAGVARNTARSSLRRRREHSLGEVEPADAAPGAEETAQKRQEREIVTAALERVPERYRDVLVLYYRGDESAESVARMLDISTEAALQRLHRGRKHLRTQVDRVLEWLRSERTRRRATAAILAYVAARSRSAAAATTASRTGAMVRGGRWLAIGAGAVVMLLTLRHASSLARESREETGNVAAAKVVDQGAKGEGREPTAEGRQPRAEGRGLRADSREPRTEDRRPRAEGRGPKAEDRGPKADDREADDREANADDREPTAESRKAEADKRELVSLPRPTAPSNTARNSQPVQVTRVAFPPASFAPLANPLESVSLPPLLGGTRLAFDLTYAFIETPPDPEEDFQMMAYTLGYEREAGALTYRASLPLLHFLTDANNTFAPGSLTLGLRYRLHQGEKGSIAIGADASHAFGWWNRPVYARSIDSYHQERYANASTGSLHLDSRAGNDRIFIQGQAGLLTVFRDSEEQLGHRFKTGLALGLGFGANAALVGELLTTTDLRRQGTGEKRR